MRLFIGEIRKSAKNFKKFDDGVTSCFYLLSIKAWLYRLHIVDNELRAPDFHPATITTPPQIPAPVSPRVWHIGRQLRAAPDVHHLQQSGPHLSPPGDPSL